jgi:hypothetical protein
LHDRQVPAPLGIGASHDARRIRLSLRRRLHHDRRRQRSQLRKVARVLGHHEWLTDARFSANHQRVAHRDELAAMIEAVTSKQPMAFWMTELEKAGVPCGPILDYEDALTTPQAIAREMTVDVDHPTLGRLRTLGRRSRCRRRRSIRSAAARCSVKHTDDVLLEAGYSSDEIEAAPLQRRDRLSPPSSVGHRLHSDGSQLCDHGFRFIFRTFIS